MKLDSPLSWIVALSSFLVHAAVFGVVYAFGIFYVALLEDFPGEESATASIVGIHLGTVMIASPLTIILSRRFTPRAVCCCGILLASTSFYLASLATNLVTLYCTFGIMFGLASSFSHLPTIIVLRANFKKHLPLAYAIGISGSGAGGMMFSLLLPSLFEARGWRGALRFLSYVTLALIVCGLVLVPCERKTEVIGDDDDTKAKKKSIPWKEKTGLQKVRRVLVPSSWRNKAFLVLNVALILLYFVLPIPYCHIVNFAVEQGLSLSQGSIFPFIMAAGTTVGRLAIGPISNGILGISHVSLCQALFLILCVAITLTPLATSAPLLIVFSGAFGLFDGAVNVLIPLVVDDVFSDPTQALQALGSLFAMFCIPYTLGSPLAGWLYSIKGSYHTVFFTCGGILFVSTCLMSLVRHFLPSSSRKTIIDVPESIVVSSASDRLLPPNPNPTKGRLMSLRMCSVLDLSADVFSETDGPTDDCSSRVYYENLVRFDPRIRLINSANPTEPLLHVSSNNISENEPYYTDITNQISGLTQSRTNGESLLNEIVIGVPDVESVELTERDVFWGINGVGDPSKKHSFETSSLDVAYDRLEVGYGDAGIVTSSSAENVNDLCNDTQCASLGDDRTSTDSAYGSLDEFQESFGEQATLEPCSIHDDQQVINDDFKYELNAV